MGRKGYRKKKPDGRKFKIVKSVGGFFGKHGDKNPPIKIQKIQDNLESHGKNTLVRINLAKKKWELWKRKGK